MKNLLSRLKKPTVNDKLTVKPAPREVAFFSYRGLGVAVNINDSTIDEVFETAKESLKAAMDREEIIDDRNKGKNREGKEVRTEEADKSGESAEPVAGKSSAGEVAPVLPRPEEPDIR